MPPRAYFFERKRKKEEEVDFVINEKSSRENLKIASIKCVLFFVFFLSVIPKPKWHICSCRHNVSLLVIMIKHGIVLYDSCDCFLADDSHCFSRKSKRENSSVL